MNNEELLNKIQALKEKRDMMTETYDSQIEAYTLLLKTNLGEGNNLKTDMATAYWQAQTKVEVKNWNKVMEFVYKNKAFDILQKRITPNALKSRLDAGGKIEGVSVSETKIFIIKGAKDEKANP
jgi:hypothetical protein